MATYSLPKNFITNSIGALWVSNSISNLLMGVVISKVVDYYSNFPNDRLLFKLIVAFMLILSLGETAGYCAWGWNWGVQGYGNPAAMLLVPVTVPFVSLCWTLATVVNQSFFAFRLYLISKNLYIVIGIAVGTSYQAGFMLWMLCPEFSGNLLFANLKDRLYPAAYSWVAVAFAIDVTITSSMFYYLGYRRRDAVSAHRSTERLLKGIVKRTVRYNALSLFVLCIEYGFFLTTEKNGLWFGLGNSILVKVFTFSIIASLAARRPQDQLTFASHTVGGVSSTKKTSGAQESGVNVVVDTRISTENEKPTQRHSTVPVHFEKRGESEKYSDNVHLVDMV